MFHGFSIFNSAAKTVFLDLPEKFSCLGDPVENSRPGNSMHDTSVVNLVQAAQDHGGEGVLGAQDNELVRVPAFLFHSGCCVDDFILFENHQPWQLCFQ